MSFTVVEYYGKQNNSRCGYCKQSRSCHSHGMHAYVMTSQDYQDLIDRGWRRSGLYCYKPNMKITCCPSYTIKCDSHEFKLSKSHKKILRRMNKFLLDGIKDKDDEDDHKISNNDDKNNKNDNIGPSSIRDEHQIPDITPKYSKLNEIPNEKYQITNKEQKIPTCSNDLKEPSMSITSDQNNKDEKKVGILDSKPQCKKAKQLRLERKKQKLEAKGISFDEFIKSNQNRNLNKNQEKTLDDYIRDEPENGRHKLKVITIPSSKGVTKEVIELYRKYQVTIHNDPPQKITKSSFERFLVKSPLQLKLIDVNCDEFRSTLKQTYGLYMKYQTIIHNDPPDNVNDYLLFLQKSPLKNKKVHDGPPDGYGSFHQQYWLDDKLIAVGVIDILPYCISSVYFFYDPDYSFLSLGTYGSLREMSFVKQLSEIVPSLKYYYMGFYIHSCPKMRYKGKLTASYLLCPEVYSWHLLTDEIKAKLDQNKYQRLNNDPNAKDENEFTENDINLVRLLIDETTYITYEQYKNSSNVNSVNDLLEFIQRRIYSEVIGTNIDATIMEYGRLVGKKCAHRMLYVK